MRLENYSRSLLRAGDAKGAIEWRSRLVQRCNNVESYFRDNARTVVKSTLESLGFRI